MAIMSAKYSGQCACGHKFNTGTAINYSREAHKVTACEKCAPQMDAPPVRVPQSRKSYGSRYTRFSSGAEVFTNKRGRCEDAPCCGCCS